MTQATHRQAEYEYVVVGSGAGGGTVAARLAEAGHTVLLLEAGGDPCQLQGGDPLDPGGERLPADYEVPAFHAFSSENEAMKWDFFVRHYADDDRQRRDPKFVEEKDGVLYPRAGTLGGCTAHHAMILLYPSNSDWDGIARLTGDDSWGAANMRRYFERLENCHHRPLSRWLKKLFGWNPSRHGFSGWLSTEVPLPMVVMEDKDMRHIIVDSARAALGEVKHPLRRFLWFLQSRLDPNDWRLVEDDAIGMRLVPLTTRNHTRVGSRERVLEVVKKHPDRLKVELDALVTRVLFDEDGGATPRAVGVEYMKGAKLYRAGHEPSRESPSPSAVYASREVILAGGAFNTPQLLMLSGVGPREELEAYGIEVRVDLPGVGSNLQDRYEVGVVYRMRREWEVLKGARFAPGDPQYEQWARHRDGVYTTNGAMMSVIAKSAPERREADLFYFALLAPFHGYYPGYSKPFAENYQYMTWAILKGQTENTAGKVRLRSSDPRDPPRINFHYFDEGNEADGKDLDAVVDAVKLVREMAAHANDEVEEEELPGKHVETREQVEQFVKDHAWGHHASCTCPIGPREEGGVLTGDFQVHGTKGLRVVDASVFPRIPGLFILSAVYMIGEKASDVILADARG